MQYKYNIQIPQFPKKSFTKNEEIFGFGRFTTYICLVIHEFSKPIPAVIKETKQDCWIWYLWSTGEWSNDVYTVVLQEGGQILHVDSQQILIASNKTFNIKK